MVFSTGEARSCSPMEMYLQGTSETANEAVQDNKLTYLFHHLRSLLSNKKKALWEVLIKDNGREI
jgi:hypothetical protein